MEILKNLFGYKEKNLEDVLINEDYYVTSKNFCLLYILGQAFGAGIDKESYNHYLAKSVLNAKEYFNRDLPTINQSEIGICLNKLGADNKLNYSIGEVYCDGEKSLLISKIDTKKVLIESKKVLDKLGLPYDSALFIAHPYHMERVLHIAKTLGISGKPFIRKNVEWAQKDSQPWVKSPFLFVPREILARIITK